MAKKFTRTQIAAVREVLCSLMPGTFAPKGMPKKPLAIGIRETVIKRVLDAHPEISIGLICATIADYVRGIRYQQALVEGAERVDADGLPSGSVDQASAAAAIGEVNRIHGVMREQRRMRELNKQEQVPVIDTTGIDQALRSAEALKAELTGGSNV